MEKIFYLAYGSNMNVEQMATRCPDAKIVGKGILDGWQLMFKGVPKWGNYATIEPCDGGRVPFVLWEISAADEISLDRYEVYPSFYYKRTLEVVTDTGENFSAMTYIMHEENPLGLPNEDYFNSIAAPYDDFGFDKKILDEAFRFSANKHWGGN